MSQANPNPSFSPVHTHRAASDHDPYVLRLFVSGLTPHSTGAISRVREICDRHLAGQFELEVIDVLKKPELARREEVVALPTLIKRHPGPPRRLVGDLSNTDRVLRCLGLAIDEK
jgi:circadian clock protein KaiB